MKNAILIIVFLANTVNAQLRVEQLTTDSLVKEFVYEQTGRKINTIKFITGKIIKEQMVNMNLSLNDSLELIKYVISDFNVDGKLDIVLCYAEGREGKRFYDGFYLNAFLSDSAGKYVNTDLTKRYGYFLGGIVNYSPVKNVFEVVNYFGIDKVNSKVIDTLKYFGGYFMNANRSCQYGFDSIRYFTTSNWAASSSQYAYITIYANGYIKKEMYNHGDKTTYKGYLKPELFKVFVQFVCEANLWELKDRYEMEYVHDIGTSHLIISNKTRIKQIDDYGHWGNFSLGNLYEQIKKMTNEADWKLIEKKDKNGKQKKLSRMPGSH